MWYFRRRAGGQRIRLPDDYGTDQFWKAYNAALTGKDGKTKKPGEGRHERGTLRWLVGQYKASAEYMALADSTKRNRDRLMQSICEHTSPDGKRTGNMLATAVTKQMLRAGMARRSAGGPEAANAFLKTMRALLNHAERIDLITDNPAMRVELLAGSAEGFYTWTVDEIVQFEARHPVGTKARLAMDLMLYTGLRKSDVVRVGRQHIRDGILTIRPEKTARTSGVVVTIELHQRVLESIEATSIGDLHLLVTEFGKPFTANGFGGWFRRRCDEAGVPGSAHGLRKAGASRLAELGATTRELMACYGWTTSKEADRYTRAADRKTLGLSGSRKMKS